MADDDARPKLDVVDEDGTRRTPRRGGARPRPDGFVPPEASVTPAAPYAPPAPGPEAAPGWTGDSGAGHRGPAYRTEEFFRGLIDELESLPLTAGEPAAGMRDAEVAKLRANLDGTAGFFATIGDGTSPAAAVAISNAYQGLAEVSALTERAGHVPEFAAALAKTSFGDPHALATDGLNSVDGDLKDAGVARPKLDDPISDADRELADSFVKKVGLPASVPDPLKGAMAAGLQDAVKSGAFVGRGLSADSSSSDVMDWMNDTGKFAPKGKESEKSAEDKSATEDDKPKSAVDDLEDKSRQQREDLESRPPYMDPYMNNMGMGGQEDGMFKAGFKAVGGATVATVKTGFGIATAVGGSFEDGAEVIMGAFSLNGAFTGGGGGPTQRAA